MNIFKNLIISNPYYVLAYLIAGFIIFIYPLKEAIENIYYRTNHEMIIAIGGNFSTKDRILSPILYIFCFLVFVVIWPIPAAFLLHQYWKSEKDEKIFKESKFYCRTEYIIDEIDSIQAESHYSIFDPLGLTPNLPFGFLNPAWQEFLSSHSKKYKIYSFYIPKSSVTNHFKERAKSDIRGFVKMRGKKIINEFLIEGNISS